MAAVAEFHALGCSARIDDMDDSLPTAKSAHSPDERAKLKRVIAERGLGGLANGHEVG
jgi:hypothetical protein